MKILALALAALLAAGPAVAQPAWKGPRGGVQRAPERPQKSDQWRERMGQDMRDAYRERPGRPERGQQMTPEQREKLRRDIENANRELRRR